MHKPSVSTNWEDYFNTTSQPSIYEDSKRNIKHFCERYKQAKGKIVLVTSGGTTVPLETNTVRFVDNFSAGTRGSASAEYFVEKGYGVIFLHREKSLEPYVRHFMGAPFLDKLEIAKKGGKASIIVNAESQKQLLPILTKYIHAKDNCQLLSIPFTTLNEYLWLLRGACGYLHSMDRHVMLYLAAAVADFYVPSSRMPEHKMHSAEGAPRIELQLVPKMLEPLVNLWVPNAFVVSFKLETDSDKLISHAQGALKKYRHQMVIGNVLDTRKTMVSVVWAGGSKTIFINKAEQKAAIEIETKIVSFLAEKHDMFIIHGADAEWSEIVAPLDIAANDNPSTAGVMPSSPLSTQHVGSEPSSPLGMHSDDGSSVQAMNVSSASSTSQSHDYVNSTVGDEDDSD